NIPADFVRTTKELGENCRSLKLRDPKGNLWPVELRSKKVRSGEYTRRVMGKGWHEFSESNKLKKGDECIFELAPTRRTSSSSNSSVLLMNVRIFPQRHERPRSVPNSDFDSESVLLD
ncbi:hypothetical protein U1Q18_005726, partial [Sarracenia purpurea var. burkii]